MLEKFDKQKDPFTVPENYFKDFNANIMDLLPTKEEKIPSAKIVPMWKKVIPWATIAAVFAGVVVTFGLFNTDSGQMPVGVTAAAAATEAAEEDDFYLFLEDEMADSFYSDAYSD